MTAVDFGDMSRPALRAIDGQESASRLLFEVRQGYSHPDALHDALWAAFAAGDADWARAFCRHFQKVVEMDAAMAIQLAQLPPR